MRAFRGLSARHGASRGVAPQVNAGPAVPWRVVPGATRGSGDAPLVVVAHGSRDPRSAATIRRLADVVCRLAPGLDIRVGFLDLSEPLLSDVLDDVAAEGHRDVVAVPLLLGNAFHSKVDLPALVADAEQRSPGLRVRVSDVLGPDPLLLDAVQGRLAETGTAPDPALGVVLAGVGSADAAANDVVADVAARLHRRGDYAAVTHAFATCGPDVESAIAALRARGAERIAIAPWFLAPGLLLDRIERRTRDVAPDAVFAAPLGAAEAVATVVLTRYAAATHPAAHAA
ncbi:sirohydrochlorin chelatase [Haloechinothrix salitolerans]|uniref:Sirohydrochlorin chelatase n=1 Tax=Haloechinothrix salitolerans TaxID=926830 RepID=A0ABW2BYB4_9PSEU